MAKTEFEKIYGELETYIAGGSCSLECLDEVRVLQDFVAGVLSSGPNISERNGVMISNQVDEIIRACHPPDLDLQLILTKVRTIK